MRASIWSEAKRWRTQGMASSCEQLCTVARPACSGHATVPCAAFPVVAGSILAWRLDSYRQGSILASRYRVWHPGLDSIPHGFILATGSAFWNPGFESGLQGSILVSRARSWPPRLACRLQPPPPAATSAWHLHHWDSCLTRVATGPSGGLGEHTSPASLHFREIRRSMQKAPLFVLRFSRIRFGGCSWDPPK